MPIESYCFRCEKIVAVHPWSMTEEQFWGAIKTDGEIKIGHESDLDGKHSWSLKRHERVNLRNNEHLLRNTKGMGA
jgi:hypothetical protein